MFAGFHGSGAQRWVAAHRVSCMASPLGGLCWPLSGNCSASYALVGVGLVPPHPLSLLCAYLFRAFPYGTPDMFSPGTLLISSRKSPLTAQSLFLLWVLWSHPFNYDSFGGSKHLLHPQCLPRAQSWVHKFWQSQVPGATVLLKNKDEPRLSSCPGRNPRTSVQRGCLGAERQVTLPLLVRRLQAEALCKGRRKQCQVDARTSP